jgi:2-haloacid dehalogenase
VPLPVKAVVFDAYGTLYDVQSVASVTEEAYPGYGEMITQIWRIKQLEYTWLRSLMRRYEDFDTITGASLRYTLRLLALPFDAALLDRITGKYRQLELYPEARTALEALRSFDLAILSNGSPAMLRELVLNTGLYQLLKATISVDPAKTFKPSPEAYALIEASLQVPPSDVLFVSSNPFDVCGAKAFGFKVAWVERVTPEMMAADCERCDVVAPVTMFHAIRQQMDELGFQPEFRIPSLAHLIGVLSSVDAA